jgi:hypothetical protein
MELVTESTKTEGSNIIVKATTIADINITYNQQREWQQYPDDIGVDLTLDVGQDFQPVMYIGGDLKKDDVNGSVIGWGRAYKVKMLFDALGLFLKLGKGKTIEENKIPQSVVDQAVGKQFVRLSYLSTKVGRTGKNIWKDWQDTTALGNENDLKTAFTDAVDKGYVKDFNPPTPWEETTEETKEVGLPL